MSEPRQRTAQEAAKRVQWWAEKQREAETALRACELAKVGEVDAALALLAGEPIVPADGSERG